MAHVAIEIDAPPDAVWRVLADPAAYAEWAFGTKHVARADVDWPREGTQLEYELGIDPIAVGDRTTVIEARPPRVLVLRAESKRLGAAKIRMEFEGNGGTTRVVMDEAPIAGLMEAVHTRVSDADLTQRNRIALERLKRLVEPGR
jgi:uncharacterized protein YndB with AHSA1/START domain